MTEISFARSFLSALDMRPTKLSSDHVSDPKEYPAQAAYILPKLPQQAPKRKRTEQEGAASTPGSEAAVTVSLKNLKSAESVTLQRQALSTSIFDIKTAYAKETNGAVDKTRLLYNKKPVPDSKTLKDVIGSSTDKEIAFTVMVMGGATAAPPVTAAKSGTTDTEMAEAPASEPLEGAAALNSQEFWTDLKGFLLQRIRDEREAEKVTAVFKKAWQSSQ